MKFTPSIGERYMGHIDRCYLAYCADEEVRSGAASGGAVSGLLLHMLEERLIDAALVTRLRYDGGRPGAGGRPGRARRTGGGGFKASPAGGNAVKQDVNRRRP